MTVGCNIMAGLCPLITIHVTSYYSWQYAMVLPGFLALTSSSLIYMTIYNCPKEAGLNDDDIKMERHAGETKSAQHSLRKILLQMLRSPFLWVLFCGDLVTATLKNGIGDWIQLYLIQDKKQLRSTGIVMN